MKGEDVDLMLSRDDNIVPSSGFTASVMEAVSREATVPPPIPFPWKWALPGLGWCLAVTILLLTMRPAPSANPPSAPPVLDLPNAVRAAYWLVATFVVTLASVALSIRIARRV